ncbi:MAG: hypothetical protein L0241_15045 [Planctomycetia bacterium]|nr:hypothetical protein [Planctomycetia bacterium]
MPKISVTAVVVVLAVAAIGYLAFDPNAARDVNNWIRRQIGTSGAPDMKEIRSPNYTPVVPGNGL